METNYMNGSGIPYKNGMPDGSGMPDGGKKMMTPEEKKKANCLCVLSLCLCYGPIVLGGFIMAGYLIVHDITIFQPFINSLDENESLATGLTLLAETVQSLCFIAAMVIMIVVRVKYPDSTFGKVLMWIYIVQIILLVVTVLVTVIACGLFIGSCIYGLRDCGEIGYVIGNMIK